MKRAFTVIWDFTRTFLSDLGLLVLGFVLCDRLGDRLGGGIPLPSAALLAALALGSAAWQILHSVGCRIRTLRDDREIHAEARTNPVIEAMWFELCKTHFPALDPPKIVVDRRRGPCAELVLVPGDEIVVLKVGPALFRVPHNAVRYALTVELARLVTDAPYQTGAAKWWATGGHEALRIVSAILTGIGLLATPDGSLMWSAYTAAALCFVLGRAIDAVALRWGEGTYHAADRIADTLLGFPLTDGIRSQIDDYPGWELAWCEPEPGGRNEAGLVRGLSSAPVTRN